MNSRVAGFICFLSVFCVRSPAALGAWRESREARIQRGDPFAVARQRKSLRLDASAPGQLGTQITVGRYRLDRAGDVVNLVGIDVQGGIAGDLGQRRGARG